jgi:iron complex transport system substrate-binding protein
MRWMSNVRMRLFVVMSIALLVLAAFSGCGQQSGKPQKITLIDDAGNHFTLAGPAEKVVSLAPANTEIIYAVGGGDKLVGVTTYCDYPAAAKKKEKVGDFTTPNVEKIVSLAPQVVFTTGGVQESFTKDLGKFNIKTFVVDPKSFSQMFSDMKKVGVILGLNEKSAQVVIGLEKRVDDVLAKVKGKPRPKVFFEIWNQPLMTAGNGTFIDKMITMAGGSNIGRSAGPQFPQFSEEQLLRDDPGVYVAVKGTQANPSDIAKRPGYSQLKAVRDGKVYIVEDNLFVRSGPRLVDGLVLLAKKLHPEVFKKND